MGLVDHYRGFLGLGFGRFRHSGFRVTLAKVTTIFSATMWLMHQLSGQGVTKSSLTGGQLLTKPISRDSRLLSRP